MKNGIKWNYIFFARQQNSSFSYRLYNAVSILELLIFICLPNIAWHQGFKANKSEKGWFLIFWPLRNRRNKQNYYILFPFSALICIQLTFKGIYSLSIGKNENILHLFVLYYCQYFQTTSKATIPDFVLILFKWVCIIYSYNIFNYFLEICVISEYRGIYTCI